MVVRRRKWLLGVGGKVGFDADDEGREGAAREREGLLPLYRNVVSRSRRNQRPTTPSHTASVDPVRNSASFGGERSHHQWWKQLHKAYLLLATYGENLILQQWKGREKVKRQKSK